MTIEELFGTLQQSVVESWRFHLKTKKYSEHIALDAFYSEMPEKVDSLIEGWIAAHEAIEDFKNILDAEEYDSLEYLEQLKDICVEGRELLDSTSLESAMDDILSLIDSTIYKVRELTENKMTDLSKYVKMTII